MNSQDKRVPYVAPAEFLRQRADEKEIAALVVAAWREIDTALCPIVGRLGVAALFRRSLHTTAIAYPWLGPASKSEEAGVEFELLMHVISQQGSSSAAAGGGALLEAFRSLLATMVGPMLTEQLLHSVWAKFGHSSTGSADAVK